MESLREENLLATQAVKGTCKLQLQTGTSMAAVMNDIALGAVMKA